MLILNHELNYYNSLKWEEVSLTKALKKMWANNEYHLKCEVGIMHYFYHGQESMKGLTSDQVKAGKWFVSR